MIPSFSASLRHSTGATTQTHYIKTIAPDAVVAMEVLRNSVVLHLCSKRHRDDPFDLVSPVRAVESFSLSYLVVYAFSRAALFLKRRQAT